MVRWSLAFFAALTALGLPLSAGAQSPAPATGASAPVIVQGQRISGRTDLETVVEGNAELQKGSTSIRADRLEYFAPTDQARAIGNVRVQRNGNVFEGPLLELKVERFEGFFDQPRYHFSRNDAYGQADRAEFLDPSHAVIRNASYSTCRRTPGPDWMPDWILRATTIRLDNDEDTGVAEGAILRFKGVPVLPVPSISFPLTDRRKSGFLPPTLGVDNVNGIQTTVPYYWNIAPNRDATITPTLMTSRGVDVGTEFRYLEPAYNGTARLNVMPADRLRNADRWGLAVTHAGVWTTGLAAVGPVYLTANLNRASDDNYWKDFTGSSASLTQRLLPNDLQSQWSRGDWSVTARVLQWQTLQDPGAPIVPPYDRFPQVTARYQKSNPRGLDWSVEGDLTQFQADRNLTLQPDALRSYALVQLSRPWVAPAGFVTPKVQLHASSYQFDRLSVKGERAAESAVPTFSLDSGLVFERDTTWAGRSLLQTLEPRAFYVYTPYRDQSGLPNYDTGVNDFNFASIYSDNSFVGHDKIADNNLLTLGVTTRFLDANSGAQLARFGVAQRLRFDEQRVTLTPSSAPAAAGVSDVLLGASVNVNDRWVLDSTVQYNPRTDQSERSTVGARYNPQPYRVVNMAYRFQRALSEQLDVSWQWPLNDLWGDRGEDLGAGRGQGPGRYYSVGRLNYSLSENRLVDAVIGLEYDAGCWLGRAVMERIQTSTNSATQRLMFQIEFVGFTRLGLGNDPRRSLAQNISRYQNLRDSAGSNSR